MHSEKNDASPVTIDAPVDVLKLGEADFRRLVVRKFDEGEGRMESLQSAINTNTELTKKTAQDTQELVNIFKNAKTGAAMFSWCGRTAKKSYPFLFLLALLYAVLHGGKWPEWWPKWGEH